jgi:hypothetical protein
MCASSSTTIYVNGIYEQHRRENVSGRDVVAGLAAAKAFKHGVKPDRRDT